MRINHNITALNNHRNMGLNNLATSKSMEKLASGLRINRAGDDAAGLAVSEKMRGQIRGLEMAQRNVQDGISFVQTAEGAMNEVSAMLTRMKELAVQKANGTYSNASGPDFDGGDKGNINLELKELSEQINNIVSQTKFNGISIASATGNDIVTIQADDGTQTIGINTIDLSKFTPITGLSASAIDGLTISTINTAIEAVAAERAKLGATQNRLEYTSNNLGTVVENLTAAESRIRDTDMAKEMVDLTRNSILLQASQAMLAQANMQPQGVLTLLR